MIVIEGQRIEIERELVRELFRPNNSPRSITDCLANQLAPRGNLTLVSAHDKVQNAPPVLHPSNEAPI